MSANSHFKFTTSQVVYIELGNCCYLTCYLRDTPDKFQSRLPLFLNAALSLTEFSTSFLLYLSKNNQIIFLSEPKSSSCAAVSSYLETRTERGIKGQDFDNKSMRNLLANNRIKSCDRIIVCLHFIKQFLVPNQERNYH